MNCGFWTWKPSPRTIVSKTTMTFQVFSLSCLLSFHISYIFISRILHSKLSSRPSQNKTKQNHPLLWVLSSFLLFVFFFLFLLWHFDPVWKKCFHFILCSSSAWANRWKSSFTGRAWITWQWRVLYCFQWWSWWLWSCWWCLAWRMFLYHSVAEPPLWEEM